MEFSLNVFNEYAGKITTGIRHFQFNNKRQLAFLEDLHLLINDGIPANRAIEMMSEVSTGLTKEVALSLAAKIAEGQPLAEGMREWFSSAVVEIIRVGESGGALPETMKSAINMLSQKNIAISSFIAAVSYPLVVLVTACGVIIYLTRTVFIQFATIKPMDQWPDAGRRLVSISNFIQDWWWIVLVVFIAIIILFRRLLSNYIGSFRDQLDQFPPFSFYRRLVSARLLETLGLLVANGVVFKSAIRVMQYQANPYMLLHLGRMEILLGKGKTNIADVLETGLVSNEDLMRLRVMAEVKGFEHGLIRMGIRGADQATQTLKLISRLIGGVFLIIGAYLILLIIQGIYFTGMALGSAAY